jgi:hypothetical protein
MGNYWTKSVNPSSTSNQTQSISNASSTTSLDEAFYDEYGVVYKPDLTKFELEVRKELSYRGFPEIILLAFPHKKLHKMKKINHVNHGSIHLDDFSPKNHCMYGLDNSGRFFITARYTDPMENKQKIITLYVTNNTFYIDGCIEGDKDTTIFPTNLYTIICRDGTIFDFFDKLINGKFASKIIYKGLTFYCGNIYGS